MQHDHMYEHCENLEPTGKYSDMREYALDKGYMVTPHAVLGYMDPEDEKKYTRIFGFGPKEKICSRVAEVLVT